MKRSGPIVLTWCLVILGTAISGPPEGGALKPTNLKTLNTSKEEDDPHVSSDGLRLYFTARTEGKSDVFVSKRPVRRQLWGPGELLDGYIQTRGDDGGVFVTPEGRYPQFLYYATKKDRLADANFDIYVAVRQSARAEFSSPTPVSAVCTPQDELHPWLSADGRDLYFSRKTAEGWRVFVASRQRNTGGGGFGVPKLVDLPIGYHHATLTPDGRTMYLQGPLDANRSGLFRTRHSAKGWDKPAPLVGLNSRAARTGDRSPSLSRDGVILYFASDRPGGKGRLGIWWILTEELK